MIALFKRLAGSRYWYPVIGGALAILLLILIGSVRACGRDHTAERQAEQTTKSGEAITAAASDAIEIIGDRVTSDKAVDAAVNDATKGIENAQSVDDIRRAVIDGVCGQQIHSNDPACRVRPTNTGK